MVTATSTERARDGHRSLFLSGLSTSVLSPYFQLSVMRKEALDRNINLFLLIMAYKALVDNIQFQYPSNESVSYYIQDSGGSYVANNQINVGVSGVVDGSNYRDTLIAAIIADANSTYSVSLANSDVIFSGEQLKSFANPSRSLNSAFQISTTRDAVVSYSGNTTNTLSLSGGTQGTDYLEYADDSGFSTNVMEVGHAVSSNTGTLTLGLNTSQISAWTLAGVIPAGKYVKIRTQNNTGSPTHSLVRSQEVLL